MVLEAVWENLDDTVKRAFQSVAGESDRVNTRKLLGALMELSDVDSVGEIIKDMQDDAGVNLEPPAVLVEDAGSFPEGVVLSPAVREALNFFNLHRIRGVTPAKLITRLLQLSGGELVIALDSKGLLTEYINRFRNLQSEP